MTRSKTPTQGGAGGSLAKKHKSTNDGVRVQVRLLSPAPYTKHKCTKTNKKNTRMEPPPGRLIFNTARGTRKRSRRITLNQNSRISPCWRVSRAYILAQNSKRLRISNAVTTAQKQKNIYIGSQYQKHRMAYVYALRCVLYQTVHQRTSPNSEQSTKHALYISPYSCDTTASKLKRALHPARDRGDRPGRPAGPGLPYGDCTGDDD